MPLPKAPAKPADILEDYGAPAKPETERTLPEARNVMATFAAAKSAAPATEKTPAETAAKKSAAAPEKRPRKAAEATPAKAPEKAPEKAPAKRRTTKKTAAAPVPTVEEAPALLERVKAPKKAAALFAPPPAAEEPAAQATPVAEAPVPAPEPAAQPKRTRRAAAKATPKTAEPVELAGKAAAPASEKTHEKAPAKTPKKAAEQPAQKPVVKAGAPKTAKPVKASKAAEKPVQSVQPAEAQAAAAQAHKPAAKAPAQEERKAEPDSRLPRRVYAQNAGRRGRAATPDDKKKLFVLDTNVLMHDPLSIFRFAEHDIFLPMTTLEELDNHKKGLTDVARNARSVSRTLDALIEANDGQLRQGVPLSLLGNTEATGRLWFETRPMGVELPAALPTFRGDNSILATVHGLHKAFPQYAVVLVSKDINMRIKATTLGIPAEDYFNDKVLDDTDMLYSGKLTLEPGFWDSVAKTLRSWQDHGTTFYEFEADDPARFIVNECISVDGDENFMALVTQVRGHTVTVRLMKDYRAKSRVKVWGINARNREQNMALNLLMDPEIDFVTILGQAGTGKTLMTLAAALTQTIDERRFSEIIMTRATVSVGEDIGFLPGTEEEKMAPWMGALEDNLEVLHASDTGGEWGRQATMDLIKNRIRVKSMSFMRGRTFLQKFVIIDEAQNLSPKQMKTLITRAGPGTKIVCLGNIAQIDTPYLTEGSSGLTYVVERFQGWAHAATITLTRGERSRLAEFAAEAL
ncbi:PhoH family protein [uncultured Sutterella sp.]|uniref:PhoH family protein n=1 Tax=uncultured Sutterella sp. TaxID=286133 RepID=UPI0025ECA4AF|nr:PhoH family protein [uncultured Sutterella sp.]